MFTLNSKDWRVWFSMISSRMIAFQKVIVDSLQTRIPEYVIIVWTGVLTEDCTAGREHYSNILPVIVQLQLYCSVAVIFFFESRRPH